MLYIPVYHDKLLLILINIFQYCRALDKLTVKFVNFTYLKIYHMHSIKLLTGSEPRSSLSCWATEYRWATISLTGGRLQGSITKHASKM